MSNSLDNKLPPELQALSQTEQRVLLAGAAAIPAAPDQQRLLATAYAANEQQSKETQMLPNSITRLLAGQSPTMRLAFGAAMLLAVLALSLVLPRGGGISPLAPAWAAAEGYMLAFDFGDGSTEEQVKPLLEELHAAVKAFKDQHGLPTEKAQRFGTHSDRRVIKKIERHSGGQSKETLEEKSRVIAMVSLPSGELLDELETALAKIPGLPAPTRTNATWFTENGLPDPDQPGIHLALNFDNDGESQSHMFYFPETATETEIEASINDWLTANRPDHKFAVDVTLVRTGEQTQLSVEIKGKAESGLAAVRVN